MTGRVLFCIAEEAKPFARKMMNHVFDIPFAPGNQRRKGQEECFYLIQSRERPTDQSKFNRSLGEDEQIESAFVGATVQECREWLMENQYANNFMDKDYLVLADERSARDETLLISVYQEVRIPFGDEEDAITLPQKADTWYDFRVEYRFANQVFVDLNFGPPEYTWFQYYLHKEKYTDGHGIFNVAKACAWGIESLEKEKEKEKAETSK